MTLTKTCCPLKPRPQQSALLNRWMGCILLFIIALSTPQRLSADNIIESTSARYLNTNPVLEIAVEHLKALKNGDILSAYKNLSSKDFKDATPITKFFEMVQATPQIRQFEGVSLNSVAFEENRAVWQGSIHDKFGLPLLNISYAIIFEEGKWLIQTMQASPYSPPQRSACLEEPQSKDFRRKHYLRQG